MVVKTSRYFEKEFKRLPQGLKDSAKKKIELLLDNVSHPSLRVKKVIGYHEVPSIMEMSINMAFRITFQVFPDFIYLRHVRTHEIFRHP